MRIPLAIAFVLASLCLAACPGPASEPSPVAGNSGKTQPKPRADVPLPFIPTDNTEAVPAGAAFIDITHGLGIEPLADDGWRIAVNGTRVDSLDASSVRLLLKDHLRESGAAPDKDGLTDAPVVIRCDYRAPTHFVLAALGGCSEAGVYRTWLAVNTPDGERGLRHYLKRHDLPAGETDTRERLHVAIEPKDGVALFDVTTAVGPTVAKQADKLSAASLKTYFGAADTASQKVYADMRVAISTLMSAQAEKAPNAEFIEISAIVLTHMIAATMPGNYAAWGYTVLALDACVAFNKARSTHDAKPLDARIKWPASYIPWGKG